MNIKQGSGKKVPHLPLHTVRKHKTTLPYVGFPYEIRRQGKYTVNINQRGSNSEHKMNIYEDEDSASSIVNNIYVTFFNHYCHPEK